MISFSGFSSGIEMVPSQFFTEILPEIDTLHEMKTILFAIYLLNQYQGDQRYILRTDFSECEPFMQGLKQLGDDPEILLDDGLEKSVLRGTLLRVDYGNTHLFFLNSPKGRLAVERLEQGQWVPDSFLHISEKANLFRPNIYQLYEENIGPLTSMISEILKDSEKIYGHEWVADAIETAVVNNARTWRYIETVLKSWKENGRNGINR